MTGEVNMAMSPPLNPKNPNKV
ncbi:protein of unknown function [Candidatus Nitrospira inopinata]|uniref:Uncharacterized protein n=1 Tax=Candidatus Nitrospira inopinata TaxID=1715989 RepID=A0A0S4KN49_9BACT|nr:protein of unknown function [Candidatus Nitrospira inopinata]